MIYVFYITSICAYGGMRYDPHDKISVEWESTGAFYFVVPHVILLSLVEARCWMQLLLGTMNFLGRWRMLLKHFRRLCFRGSLGVSVLSKNHVRQKERITPAVEKALEMIKQNSSSLRPQTASTARKLARLQHIYSQLVGG
ncbi:hypothetical protein F2Q68_00012210 [Brassica cretica]|uniref:Uncharacterized protein n=1 Tax=Brassica cretica TaxID=69181 RepID=A0A8S9KWX5_BRACR|nr:hypothetical protein F2Q68_00012210 [Brassica cretica]